MAEEEKQRVAKQREELGEAGLKAKDETLQKATEENEVPDQGGNWMPRIFDRVRALSKDSFIPKTTIKDLHTKDFFPACWLAC